MNQTVKRIVDLLFEDTVENEETKALHEELMNNCQEHYEDLVRRGLTEDEATGEVVDSLKGMKEVIDEYPKKPGAEKQKHSSSGNSNSPNRPIKNNKNGNSVASMISSVLGKCLKE